MRHATSVSGPLDVEGAGAYSQHVDVLSALSASNELDLLITTLFKPALICINVIPTLSSPKITGGMNGGKAPETLILCPLHANAYQ